MYYFIIFINSTMTFLISTQIIDGFCWFLSIIYIGLYLRFITKYIIMEDHRTYLKETNEKENSYEGIDKKYLIRQNRKIRMELRQAKEICEMHKNALVQLSDPLADKNIVFQALIGLLKNDNQSKRYEEMKNQIGELESKVLVLEKIVEQALNNQKQTYNLLVHDFKKLKQNNIEKDEQLNEFDKKIGEIDYLSGLVTKYKEIVRPSEQSMAFQKEQTQLLDMLNIHKETIRKLTEEKDKLMRINIHLKEELDKKKDDIQNLTMFLDNNPNRTMILDEIDTDGSIIQPNANRSLINVNINHSLNHSTNTHNHSVMKTLHFIEMQRELIKEQNEAEADSDTDNNQCPELALLFPDKVKLIKSARERKKVPYLNMLKVRELMAKREIQLKKEIQAGNMNMNPTTKIIQLQNQLEITRKQLSNYMLKYRTIDEDIKKYLNYIRELEGRNQVLLKANKRLNKMYTQYLIDETQLCRFIISYIETVTGRKLRPLTLQSIKAVLDQYLTPFNIKNVYHKSNLSRILIPRIGKGYKKRCLSTSQ